MICFLEFLDTTRTESALSLTENRYIRLWNKIVIVFHFLKIS